MLQNCCIVIIIVQKFFFLAKSLLLYHDRSDCVSQLYTSSPHKCNWTPDLYKQSHGLKTFYFNLLDWYWDYYAMNYKLCVHYLCLNMQVQPSKPLTEPPSFMELFKRQTLQRLSSSHTQSLSTSYREHQTLSTSSTLPSNEIKRTPCYCSYIGL